MTYKISILFCLIKLFFLDTANNLIGRHMTKYSLRFSQLGWWFFVSNSKFSNFQSRGYWFAPSHGSGSGWFDFQSEMYTHFIGPNMIFSVRIIVKSNVVGIQCDFSIQWLDLLVWALRGCRIWEEFPNSWVQELVLYSVCCMYKDKMSYKYATKIHGVKIV